MDIRAAVLRDKGEPFSLEQLRLEGPRADEVLVRVVAAGICHADLLVQSQEYPTDLPVVVGHEGSGVVEEVGSAVTDIEPGDHVVLIADSCGRCELCLTGHPSLCEDLWRLNFLGRRADGSTSLSDEVGGRFCGQSSFASHCLAARRSVVRVPKDAPLELLGPLGCGVRTGVGIVLNAVSPRPGMSIGVFGVGSVGMSAVMAAKLAACTTIVAVDVEARRLALARELGATHTVNPSESDALERLREIGGGRGLDRTVEASGNPEALRLAVDCLKSSGQCGVVGAPAVGVGVELDVTDIVLGKTIKGAPSGDTVAAVDVPRLIELQRAGLFPFERLITMYEFDQINQAVEDIEQGLVVKAVVRMGGVS